MKFEVQPAVIEATNHPDKRVVTVAWSPDGERFAVATAGRTVAIMRADGKEDTRFGVKARDDKSNRAFTITGISWAPDSSRIAIGQSDMAIAVYDIGPASSSETRKKITIRFSHKSSILCVGWPATSSSEFVYGLSEGTVNCGLTKMKKTEELYRHAAAPLTIAAAGRSNSVAVGHLDGTVFVVNLDNRSRIIAIQAGVPPQALAWGSQIVAAGSDLQVHFGDPTGSSNSHVDFSNQPGLRAFTSAAFDPSGSTAVVAGKNALIAFTYTPRLQTWTQQTKIEFDGLYSVASMAWSPDGSKIAVASVTGAVFVVTASIGSFRYKSLFEVVHVTGSQIKVISLKSESRKELTMKSEYRILVTNFHNDRYAVCRTTQSFLIGDTHSGKTCELPTTICEGEPRINERFVFVDDAAALVWNAGELAIAEFGKPLSFTSVSTQYASPYLLSLRLNGKIGTRTGKVLAYLVNTKTVEIVNLETQGRIATASIDNKIDWLELNVAGTMLLLRDSKRALYLWNAATEQRTILLNMCSYAQWVPEANVIVAQSRKSMYVWYSPASPDEPMIKEIEGDIVDITRTGTKTAVLVSMNGTTAKVPLDGTFIAFSAAMQAGNLNDAAKTLLDMQQEDGALKGLWNELAETALRESNYVIAEIGYSNVGDLSRARFLHKINKAIDRYGMNHCIVQSHIAMLQGSFKVAEACLIEHDQLDSAFDMYRSMHMWNELLDLAEFRCPAKAGKLTEEYYAHLVSTGQYLVAAKLKARRGELTEAIDLCLQGNKPQLAAEILLNNSDTAKPQLMQHVAESLIKSERFDVAGRIYEKLGRANDALSAYRNGNSFYRALELAKAASPELVTTIEKEWADHLVSQGQNDAATCHYIESGDYALALNCSLRAQQWHQAADILRSIGSSTELRDELKLQYLRVGRHFASVQEASVAEDLFLIVDAHKELIEMYLQLGRVDDALGHGKRQMKPNEMEKLFIQVAKKNEKKANTRAIAEKIYIGIKKADMAIEMYSAANDTEAVVRLTSQFGGDKSRLGTMATQAEKDGDLATAESCYVRAGQWEKALFMYRQEKKWQDAMRIAKQHGDQNSEVQIGLYWARDIGGAAGVQKLTQLKLVEPALLHCCENGIIDFATLIMAQAKGLNKTTLRQAHMKMACALEAQNKFQDAESHYIACEQPREAVEMYVHNKMWSDAQRIATKYSITDITVTPSKGSGSPDKTATSKLVGVKKAMKLEEQKHYEEAIHAYLALTPSECGGDTRYDQVLERAVRLAANYQQKSLPQVVTTVAQLLIDAGRHASLGKILEGIDATADAFEIYKMANMWEDAKRLSVHLDPDEQKTFKRDYQQHLASNSDTSGLISMGQVDTALQVYAQKGDWETCLKHAQKEGAEYVEKYTMLYAQDLVNQKKYDDAIAILAKYSPSASYSNIQAYISLCRSTIYAVPTFDTIKPSFFALRKMLFKVLKNAEPKAKGFVELRNFTRALHLMCQTAECEKYGLHELAVKSSIAVLRYCNVLPADFLFYRAEELCRKTGRPAAAMIFANRFVDISETIKSGNISDTKSVDHSAFEDTDVPRELCLRKCSAVDDDVASEVSDWVIQQTMSSDVEAELPLNACPKCNKRIYEASLTCPRCNNTSDFCHVTGYPVNNSTSCTACGVTANRGDWGQYISRAGRCPCCDAPQTAGA